MSISHDVAIVGSGVTGATFALALAQSTSLSIALIDAKSLPVWKENASYHRVSAISLASQAIFQNLKVWENILSKRVSAYSHMFVWESERSEKIHFDSKEIGVPALGYIIEDDVIRTSLIEKLQSYPQVDIFPSHSLSSLEEIKSRLIIGADGIHSWVREQAGIELKKGREDHSALVATVKTELPHQSTAWQCFLPHGPLAFLPLSDPHTSSIVWSSSREYIDELLALEEREFQKILAESFENKLGCVINASARHHFPLCTRHAKQYVKPGLALIGDAAHTPHPLIGQGANLGLLDAVCLAEIIEDAIEKKRDFSSFPTLRRYERFRKGDNLMMLKIAEGFKFLFTQKNSVLSLLRHQGLNFADRFSPAKSFFANYALGRRGDLPRLARVREHEKEDMPL